MCIACNMHLSINGHRLNHFKQIDAQEELVRVVIIHSPLCFSIKKKKKHVSAGRLCRAAAWLDGCNKKVSYTYSIANLNINYTVKLVA